MKNPITISIPKPCSENWSEMTPVQQGRFCQSCQKKVFDFTQSSDREIAKAFENNTSLCGRFENSQLNRELIVPKEKSSVWMATTSAIISFLGLGTDEISAQEQPKTEQTDNKVLQGKPVPVQANEEITITGTVSDNYGTLPGANVVVKGTTRAVQTDMDGNFSIRVKVKDVLVISFLGMEEKSITIKKGKTNLKIKLGSSNSIMGIVHYED